MATPVLTLPAELRNRIFEYVLHDPNQPKSDYVSFDDAIRGAPKLLHTCRQLRNELWPIYFSSMKIAIDVSSPEIERFQCFVEATDHNLISSLQRLSLTLPCNGCAEFGHLHRYAACHIMHSVLYDIEKSVSGRFEVRESHGFWIRESGQWTFGQTMRRTDGLGYSTCTNWSVLPVSVDDWDGLRIEKTKLLALIRRLCVHESVAARLEAAKGKQDLSRDRKRCVLYSV